MCNSLRRLPAIVHRPSWLLRLSVAGLLILIAITVLPINAAYADGTVWVKVPPECIGSPPRDIVTWWSPGSVENAIKDTLPGEWGPPLSPITYESLKSGAILIRTRIKYHDEIGPLAANYDYLTANVDHPRGGPQDYTPPGCEAASTMNTIHDGRRHSNTSAYPYNSNGATDATSGRWVVTISGNVLFLGFDYNVQAKTVECNKNSGDWEFCALTALFAREHPDGSHENNHQARRLNTAPANRIEFQAEAFWDRYQPRSEHAWWCLTGISGYSGKCFLEAYPNNGTGFGSNQSYWSISPQVNFAVPFPVADGSTPWYVWIRGWGGSWNDDSVHIGLNGTPVTSGQDVSGYNWHNSGWFWESIRMNGSRPYVTPNYYARDSSFHTLNLWMREDGMRVDKIILTTDPNYQP